jgi:hypothetical protein
VIFLVSFDLLISCYLSIPFYAMHISIGIGNNLKIVGTLCIKSQDLTYKNIILTLSEMFLNKQRRPEACIILQQCTRRSYYLPVYFHTEGAILFEKSDK